MSFFRFCAGLAALMVVTGCTEPKETTGIGAATGGVIGAGLGAIIGNQTGNPGSGLVIGAAAGAGTGALVANSLQATEERGLTQDEEIGRQRDLMDAQRRELEELRRSKNDRVASNYAGSSQSSSVLAQPRRDSRLERAYANARTLKDTGSVATSSSFKEVRASTVRNEPSRPGTVSFRKVGDGVVERSIVTSTGAIAPHVVATEKVAVNRAIKPGKSTIKEEDPTSDESGADGEENSDDGEDEVVPAKGMKAAVTESDTARGSFGWTKGSTDSTPSSGCSEAQGELEKADSATESSDKLFHLRRALRLCPEDPSFHVKTAQLYQKLNRNKDASFEYREALSLDPELEVAKKALSELGDE